MNRTGPNMYYNTALRTLLAADWFKLFTPSPDRLLHRNQFTPSKIGLLHGNHSTS